ncbi:hypothetical protein MBLNU459_g4544t1 [Dothideomycetes sp. NU459]
MQPPPKRRKSDARAQSSQDIAASNATTRIMLGHQGALRGWMTMNPLTSPQISGAVPMTGRPSQPRHYLALQAQTPTPVTAPSPLLPSSAEVPRLMPTANGPSKRGRPRTHQQTLQQQQQTLQHQQHQQQHQTQFQTQPQPQPQGQQHPQQQQHLHHPVHPPTRELDPHISPHVNNSTRTVPALTTMDGQSLPSPAPSDEGVPKVPRHPAPTVTSVLGPTDVAANIVRSGALRPSLNTTRSQSIAIPPVLTSTRASSTASLQNHLQNTTPLQTQNTAPPQPLLGASPDPALGAPSRRPRARVPPPNRSETMLRPNSRDIFSVAFCMPQLDWFEYHHYKTFNDSDRNRILLVREATLSGDASYIFLSLLTCRWRLNILEMAEAPVFLQQFPWHGLFTVDGLHYPVAAMNINVLQFLGSFPVPYEDLNLKLGAHDLSVMLGEAARCVNGLEWSWQDVTRFCTAQHTLPLTQHLHRALNIISPVLQRVAVRALMDQTWGGYSQRAFEEFTREQQSYFEKGALDVTAAATQHGRGNPAATQMPPPSPFPKVLPLSLQLRPSLNLHQRRKIHYALPLSLNLYHTLKPHYIFPLIINFHYRLILLSILLLSPSLKYRFSL